MYRIISRNTPQFSSILSKSSRLPIPLSITPSKTTFTSRTMSSTSRSSISPKFSPGSDTKALQNTLEHELLPPHSRWQLTPSGEGIQRLIRFKTFKAAWTFMDRVASECKSAKHHPEWANVYNTVFVRWTTHNPKGLSEKDVTMAMSCDQHAVELGEIVSEGEDAAMNGEGIEGLVQGISKAAGDCCVPGKK